MSSGVTFGICFLEQYSDIAILASNNPFEWEYPSELTSLFFISSTIGSGASNPNVAGLPIFNFKTSRPLSIILLASSITGPRMS